MASTNPVLSIIGLASLLVGCGRPGLSPTATEEAPPALQEYMGRRIATTMHFAGASWLIRERREREEASSPMIERLGLRPGQTVCDLGCGNGYHTLGLAERVGPTGRTLAVDIQPEMLELVDEFDGLPWQNMMFFAAAP